MSTLTFIIDDKSTSTTNPTVQVTITENADGTLTFTIEQLVDAAGDYVGDLRGLFFDLADETLIGSLTATGAGVTEVQHSNDGVTNLGDGSNMQGLTGTTSDTEGKGYDVGIEIGTSGIGKDDIRSITFTLGSSARYLTLDDFANMDFGIRITSIGKVLTYDSATGDYTLGSRTGSTKIVEKIFDPVNASDDKAEVVEDTCVTGNLLANDGSASGTTVLTGITSGGGTASFSASDPIVVTLASGAVITIWSNGDYKVDATDADSLAQGVIESAALGYTLLQTSPEGDTVTGQANFNVCITGVNDAPTLADPADGSIAEDDQLSTTTDLGLSGFLAGADVDGDTLTYGIDGGIDGGATVSLAGTYGTLTVNKTTGEYSYAKNAAAIEALDDGETPFDEFTVTVSDGDGPLVMQTYRVDLTGANDAPTSSNDSVGTAEDTAVVLGLGDFGGFSDVDAGDTLQAVKITALETDGSLEYDTTGLGAWAAVTLDQVIGAADIAAGRLRFVPDADENGSPYATIGFKVGDGTAFSAADYTLTVNVTAVNDAPVNTVPGAQTVNQATMTAIAGLSVADVDAGGSPIKITLSADHGDLALGTTTGLTFSDAQGDHQLVFTGTLAAVNAAIATLSYTGDAAFTGGDTITMVSDDQGATGSGGAKTDTDTIAVTVNATNHAPTTPVFTFNPAAINGDGGNKLNASTVLGMYSSTDPDAAAGDFVQYSFSGAAPTGLSVNSASGALSTTADLNAVDTTFSVVATDSHGSMSPATTVRLWIGTAGVNNFSAIGNTDTIIAFGLNQNDSISITGGTGNDILVGGAGDDALSGGGGSDALYGMAGTNTLTGGADNDLFNFQKLTSPTNHVTDLDAGTNSTTIDTLRFDVGLGASEFSVGDNNTLVENFKSGDNATINVAGTEVAVKTDASVSTAAVQSTINGYGNITTGALFVFHNTTLGHAAVYHDANPSAAGGAVLVAELDNITTLAGLADFNLGDFLFA